MYEVLLQKGCAVLCADWYVHIQTIVSNRYSITELGYSSTQSRYSNRENELFPITNCSIKYPAKDLRSRFNKKIKIKSRKKEEKKIQRKIYKL